MEKFSPEKCSFYICTRWDVYPEWKKKIKSQLKNLIVWFKGGSATMGDLEGNYKSCYELIMFYVKGKPKLQEGRDWNVWEIKQKSNELHPTQKPVELPARAIKNSSKENDIIADFFLGSGTTLIAAHQTGRICYGCEISEPYCDVILDRYAKFTGDDPIRESDNVKWSELKTSSGNRTD